VRAPERITSGVSDRLLAIGSIAGWRRVFDGFDPAYLPGVQEGADALGAARYSLADLFSSPRLARKLSLLSSSTVARRMERAFALAAAWEPPPPPQALDVANEVSRRVVDEAAEDAETFSGARNRLTGGVRGELLARSQDEIIVLGSRIAALRDEDLPLALAAAGGMYSASVRRLLLRLVSDLRAAEIQSYLERSRLAA